MKKILVLFDIPGMTQQQYDNSLKDLEAAGALHQKSRPHHFASPKKDGWFVADVWDSEEALNKFSETLVPILVNNGITPAVPLVMPLYNEMD